MVIPYGPETSPTAQPLLTFHPPASDQTPVLIVGNEKAGVDPGLLALCDVVLQLPMQGHKESLNVAVAFGIAAYTLTFMLAEPQCAAPASAADTPRANG